MEKQREPSWVTQFLSSLPRPLVWAWAQMVAPWGAPDLSRAFAMSFVDVAR